MSNQVRYSLVTRSPEQDLIPYAESHGRVVIAYSPLAQGLLSGRYNPGNLHGHRVRATNSFFLPDNLKRAVGVLAALREVADVHSATPAQIALAWAIHSPAVVAIPGASSVAQLESNVAATEIELTDDEDRELRTAAENSKPITGAAATIRGLARTRFRGR